MKLNAAGAGAGAGAAAEGTLTGPMDKIRLNISLC